MPGIALNQFWQRNPPGQALHFRLMEGPLQLPRREFPHRHQTRQVEDRPENRGHRNPPDLVDLVGRENGHVSLNSLSRL